LIWLKLARCAGPACLRRRTADCKQSSAAWACLDL